MDSRTRIDNTIFKINQVKHQIAINTSNINDISGTLQSKINLPVPNVRYINFLVDGNPGYWNHSYFINNVTISSTKSGQQQTTYKQLSYVGDYNCLAINYYGYKAGIFPFINGTNYNYANRDVYINIAYNPLNNPVAGVASFPNLLYGADNTNQNDASWVYLLGIDSTTIQKTSSDKFTITFNCYGPHSAPGDPAPTTTYLYQYSLDFSGNSYTPNYTYSNLNIPNASLGDISGLFNGAVYTDNSPVTWPIWQPNEAVSESTLGLFRPTMYPDLSGVFKDTKDAIIVVKVINQTTVTPTPIVVDELFNAQTSNDLTNYEQIINIYNLSNSNSNNYGQIALTNSTGQPLHNVAAFQLAKLNFIGGTYPNNWYVFPF